jgi:hypothetical protein
MLARTPHAVKTTLFPTVAHFSLATFIGNWVHFVLRDFDERTRLDCGNNHEEFGLTFFQTRYFSMAVGQNADNSVSTVRRDISYRFFCFDSLLPLPSFTGYWEKLCNLQPP